MPKKKNLFNPFQWKMLRCARVIICKLHGKGPSPSATLRMSFSKALRVCCAASNCLHWSSMERTLGKNINNECVFWNSSKVSRNKVKWCVFQFSSDSRSNKHDQQCKYCISMEDLWGIDERRCNTIFVSNCLRYGDSPQVLFASQPSLQLSPPDKVTAQVLLETISARAASAANWAAVASSCLVQGHFGLEKSFVTNFWVMKPV